MLVLTIPDRLEIVATARVLLAVYPDNILAAVSALVDLNLDDGNDERAELWTAIAVAIADLQALARAH